MSNHSAGNETEITTCDEVTPGTRILVVDDDEEIRKLHAAMLILEDYEVLTAISTALHPFETGLPVAA